jgi:hypothetical protein
MSAVLREPHTGFIEGFYRRASNRVCWSQTSALRTQVLPSLICHAESTIGYVDVVGGG